MEEREISPSHVQLVSPEIEVQLSSVRGDDIEQRSLRPNAIEIVELPQQAPNAQ